MGNTLSFRHNVMTVQSLESFASLRGGFRNGMRDVYFVRAVGESRNFAAAITELDRKMDSAGLIYKRLSTLPRLQQREDSDYYAGQFTAWQSGKAISLRSKCTNPQFAEVLADAAKRTAELFRLTRPEANDTIVKNMMVKFWFWTDSILKDVIPQWNERIAVKLVAENVTNVQEYLFWHMLTLLGCDVLLLNSHADLNADSKILELSVVLKLGAFGNTPIPAYVPPKPAAPAPAVRQTARKEPANANPYAGTAPIAPSSHNHLTLPPRNRPSKHPAPAPAPAPVPAPPARTPSRPAAPQPRIPAAPQTPVPAAPSRPTVQAAPPVRNVGPQEKNFEELAKLASSIVMIAVVDRSGKVAATGSGIMIGKDGYILTNNHVVDGGLLFSVRIEDDEKPYITTEVIKRNAHLDLAVIRIKRKLNPLPILAAHKELVRGQKVVAIGSPLGLFNSVSDGIIAGFRTIQDRDMIQFTAPISHGSSGGAVLNMFGEIIGISTAGIDSGQNLNLAVGYKDIRTFAMGFYD